ncbi:MAG: NADH-quinone oxidoreductase subunit C [Candidatus Margulisiibacteriota bacterium]|jgi:Ni,Fe-hydrogenase III large subunit/Ni,Fe-hydrogenase III component G
MSSTSLLFKLQEKLGALLISSSVKYPDEVLLKVKADNFQPCCKTLHEYLRSPVMMLFANDRRKTSNSYEVIAVFAAYVYKSWVQVSIDIPADDPRFPSLAKSIYSANLFEREIKELFGIEAEGHPDLRRLHLHDEVWPVGNYPLRKDFTGTALGSELSPYKFSHVEGEGIFEVPVGPVHAGIIGPGHFRFSVAGEPIINLELRLGFTHRGVEKHFEGRKCLEAVTLAECVSGDSSFAHSLAYSMAVEKICGLKEDLNTGYTRGIFLELERMYNHANDLGGMATDVGFSFPAALASVLKEEILQLNDDLTGHRYLKNINQPGELSLEIDQVKKDILKMSLPQIEEDFAELAQLLNNSASFLDRTENTGTLRQKTAEDLGIVGLAARASGIPNDIRKSFSEIHKEAEMTMAIEQGGDCLARLKVRITEFTESVRLIKTFLAKLTPDRRPNYTPAANWPKAGKALGYAEGWRGPVLYWLETAENGSISRCKIVDPSFHNWPGLSYAVLGDIIPDFPLCNKSFDLSYAGNDL